MKLVTWNVNSLTARLGFVVDWIEANEPDVLCIQETKQSEENFPKQKFTDLGYESAHFGTGRWNGVAILSKVGLDRIQKGFGEVGEEPRMIAADCGGVRVHSVYVPNGRSLDNDHYAYKLRWLAQLKDFLSKTCQRSDPVVVCGDFNVAPTDDDVFDPEAFVGATHVSQPERDALSSLLSWGLIDVFYLAHPEGKIFSWWDYRGGSFHRGRGMRIDLTLATKTLAKTCSFAEVDRNARKNSPAGDKPSDHAPVVVTLTPL